MRTPRGLLAGQAAYYLATGVWPIAHMRSFEALTGPKASPWLVKSFGALTGAAGAALAAAAATEEELRAPTATLGVGCAAVLAGSDLRYALSGRIRRTYLIDAAAQAGILAGWARALSSGGDSAPRMGA
jgi:hypothetical protein